MSNTNPAEVVQHIELSKLHPFPDHPFGVRDDENMQQTVESIREYGVLVPAIARPREDGGYELIAGHRRKHACELAGFSTMPVIVRDMDRNAATIIMVDSNLQRENILPSERAKAYKMKLDAIRRQAGRPTKNSDQVGQNFEGKTSRAILAENSPDSSTQIFRYIRLNELQPDLMKMVDEGKIGMTPAVEISYLKPDEQRLLIETIDSEQATPSLSQAQRMKKLSQEGKLTDDSMLSMRYEEKSIPVLFGHKENCCGCSACYAVCPVQAISMVPDAEGFAYPVIDGSKCIRCGRCAAVCTFRRDQARKGMCSGGASVQSEPACPGQFDAPLCHAVKHKCLDIRMASRSGGVFTALSDPVLARGGVVYGCVLTDSFDAVHIRAAEPADRDRMRGSKYIQSNLLDTFLEVRADLEAGRDVLFSGTSCQVAGLRSFLKKDYAKLLCVDIVCHGVPSPRVWHAFLDWQRSRNHAEITSVDFRNKLHFGWSSHVESVYLQNGKRADSEVFKNLFYGHHVLRESCYKCPYKSTQHPGDLTIADYWGIDQAAPGFNDNKGVSLVLLNNPRGTEAFRNILPELDHRATRLEDSLQPPLVVPFERPRERERFWADFETLAFDRIARKYANFGAINSVKAALRELKHKAGRLVRKCFPRARK